MNEHKRKRGRNGADEALYARANSEAQSGPDRLSALEQSGRNGRDPVSAMLRDELAKLDRLSDPEPPDADWFARIVEKGKRESRRKLIRDLILFWLTAAAILTVYAGVTRGYPALFLAIQLVAVSAVPVVLAVALRRKRVSGRD